MDEQTKQPGRPKKPEGFNVNHLKLANAVKIGHSELAYFTDQEYDLVITGMVVKITKRILPNQVKTSSDSETVYTSLFNAISWHK